jgi:hypothetical protein
MSKVIIRAPFYRSWSRVVFLLYRYPFFPGYCRLLVLDKDDNALDRYLVYKIEKKKIERFINIIALTYFTK